MSVCKVDTIVPYASDAPFYKNEFMGSAQKSSRVFRRQTWARIVWHAI